MTRRYSIFMILFVSVAVCLVGCVPLWQVPEGISRMGDVPLWVFLQSLQYEVTREEPHFPFIYRIYGKGILITAIAWAASLAVGHGCYLLFFGGTNSDSGRKGPTG